MQEEQKKSSRKKPQSFLGELFEWVKILLVAGIAAFLLNNYVIANSTIPTGSMENTIMAGSRVFGSRLHYRFGTVERGDVAIFLYGYQCRNDHQIYRENEQGVCPYDGREDKRNQVIYYVKRVIGMPGDHVEVKKTGEVDAGMIKKLAVQSSSGKCSRGNSLYQWGSHYGKLFAGADDCGRKPVSRGGCYRTGGILFYDGRQSKQLCGCPFLGRKPVCKAGENAGEGISLLLAFK